MARLQLDVEQFWKDDEIAHLDNCFNPDAKQIAMGIRMNDECPFAELGVSGHPWGKNPPEMMRDLCRRYNDKAEQIVGRRLLSEEYPKPAQRFPALKRIGEVFGAEYIMHHHLEWLQPSCSTTEELEKVLDRVEALDIADFIIPDNWEQACRRIYEETGLKPDPVELGCHDVRGPVTAATSVYGTENLMMLYYEAPELFERFGQVMGKAILALAKAGDAACGYSEENHPHGYGFWDDNCCMLTPEMYEIFAFDTLKTVFNYYSPDPGDRRYQHSDSAMEHIVPILGRLNLTACNFGPTVLVDHIRRYMPNTRIDGCIAPLTFMSNDEEAIIAEVKRDCEMAKMSGIRGLNLTTAGQVNNGTLLSSLYTVMAAIQTYGRY